MQETSLALIAASGMAAASAWRLRRCVGAIRHGEPAFPGKRWWFTAALLATAMLVTWGVFSASAGRATSRTATGFAVALPTPDAGDATYAMARVRIVPSSQRLLARPGPTAAYVFAGRIGGLAIVARSTEWGALRASARVYVAVARVAGASASVRDVALFIVRRLSRASRSLPRNGEVVFSIANAVPAVGSFWDRGVDRRGDAQVFVVRDILATAVANWGRYLRVLLAARALAASVHPVDASPRTLAPPLAARAGAPRRRPWLWTGGQHPTRRARALFRLLVDALGTPLEYARAKTNPLVADFIAHDLNNPRLAKRWRAVTARLPTRIPDRYAAAAQEEARFTPVRAPRIARARVAIADGDNSATQFRNDLEENSTSLSVNVEEGGRVIGKTFVYGPNIDCAGPGSCDATFLTGATWETLNAIPAGQSLFAGWDGCDQIVAGACKVLVGDANRTVTAHFNQPATLYITNPGNGTGIVEDIDCFLLFCTNGNVVRCDLGPGETCSHQFTPGSSVELGGNFDRRYDSLTWNGCDSVSDNNCTVTIGPAGKRVIALFERLPSTDPPPVAAFTIAPNPAMPEQPVTFDASGSNDPDGTITNYHWQFGDGSPPQDTTSPTTIHSYFCTGTVQVGLTVTDDSGQTAGFSVPLTITPQTGFPACGG